jgi:hypothetical protein
MGFAVALPTLRLLGAKFLTLNSHQTEPQELDRSLSKNIDDNVWLWVLFMINVVKNKGVPYFSNIVAKLAAWFTKKKGGR